MKIKDIIANLDKSEANMDDSVKFYNTWRGYED